MAGVRAHRTRTGKLAVTRSDGRPHVTPVWFLLDGDDVVFTTSENTVKGRALRRNPRAALCVDEEKPFYSYVMIEGTVTISTDLDEIRHWAALIAGRSMGADRAEEYGEGDAVPGETLVRLHADKVIAQRDLAA